jgi:hypothetical protein
MLHLYPNLNKLDYVQNINENFESIRVILNDYVGDEDADPYLNPGSRRMPDNADDYVIQCYDEIDTIDAAVKFMAEKGLDRQIIDVNYFLNTVIVKIGEYAQLFC